MIEFMEWIKTMEREDFILFLVMSVFCLKFVVSGAK